MTEALDRAPEAPDLLSIPGVAPVTAAVFLGSIGDPAAYDSSRQVLRVAGLTLVERSSGLLKGQKRISKRGRPVFRRHAYIFAVRSVQKDGFFRAEYEALCGRNGCRKIAALTAVSRSALRLMLSIARDRRIVGWRRLRVAAQRPGARRPRAGDLRARGRSGGSAHPSQRPRRAVSLDPLHGAAGGSGDRALRRQPRRLL